MATRPRSAEREGPPSRERHRIPAAYWAFIALGAVFVAPQFVLVVLRGAKMVSEGTASVFEVVLWCLAAAAFCPVLVVVILGIVGRGRLRETRELAERFPRAVVVTTSVNEERREALTAVGELTRRLRFPIEMRVVMTSTSMSFWRRDLRRPAITIGATSITYAVGDYFTVAGKFATLRARVAHGNTFVDIPLFPLDPTRRFALKALPRNELARIAQQLNDAAGTD